MEPDKWLYKQPCPPWWWSWMATAFALLFAMIAVRYNDSRSGYDQWEDSHRVFALLFATKRPDITRQVWPKTPNPPKSAPGTAPGPPTVLIRRNSQRFEKHLDKPCVQLPKNIGLVTLFV